MDTITFKILISLTMSLKLDILLLEVVIVYLYDLIDSDIYLMDLKCQKQMIHALELYFQL